MEPHQTDAKPEGKASESQNETPAAEQQSVVEQLQALLKEKESKYVYLYAEFENFKKRAFRERDDARKFGWEPVALELLEVIDNLTRAVAHMPQGIDKNLAQGIQLVLGQLRAALQKYGVQEMEVAGKAFDPNFHEAVGQEAAKEPAGTIIKEVQKGYLLHGRLLRPARVIVSNGPA